MTVIILSALAAFLLWAACSDEESPATGPNNTELTASKVTSGGCKVFEKVGVDTGITASNQDCIAYSYDTTGTLHISHINATFNCCPDSFIVEPGLENNVITIVEKEDLAGGGCDCLCVFDLEYSISGIEPGTYTIHVVEPYWSEQAGPVLEFSVNLATTPTGTFCVIRTTYPWDVSYELSAEVTSLSECNVTSSGSASQSLLQNCVQYGYDASVLTIDHTNAVFNCCADSSDVTIRVFMDTIYIEEEQYYVQSAPCRCVCPMDLSYRILDLMPGQYTVQVIGPYVPDMDDTLTFNIDLSASPTGEYCVDYPW
jgi:hypothetical protein